MNRMYRLKLDEPPVLGSYTGTGLRPGTISFTQSPLYWLCMFVRFEGEVIVNGVTNDFLPDTLIIVPPTSLVQLTRFKEEDDETVYYLHFQENPDATFEARIRETTRVEVAGPAYRRTLNRSFDYSPVTKSCTRSMLWTMLWDASQGLAHEVEHPAIAKLNEFLDLNLSSAISVQEMTEACGVSHNHLIRLVKSQYGQTPQMYLRSKRMQVASNLLVSSQLSIKVIAYQVGIPDLAQFSKTVRETFGSSPRQLRSMDTLMKVYLPEG